MTTNEHLAPSNHKYLNLKKKFKMLLKKVIRKELKKKI